MFQLFETIRLENGQLHNLDYHQRRLDHSFKNLYPGHRSLNIESITSDKVINAGLFKCRISYNQERFDVKIEPYVRKIPSSLKLIRDNEIEYDYKFENRDHLKRLYDHRSACSDILIIKNGHVTDTSIGNICFEKNGIWYTSDRPLLKGTQRALMIDSELAEECEISLGSIPQFDRFMVVNAMLPFDLSNAYPVDQICK